MQDAVLSLTLARRTVATCDALTPSSLSSLGRPDWWLLVATGATRARPCRQHKKTSHKITPLYSLVQ